MKKKVVVAISDKYFKTIFIIQLLFEATVH